MLRKKQLNSFPELLVHNFLTLAQSIDRQDIQIHSLVIIAEWFK